jgi:hypothetical protein
MRFFCCGAKSQPPEVDQGQMPAEGPGDDALAVHPPGGLRVPHATAGGAAAAQQRLEEQLAPQAQRLGPARTPHEILEEAGIFAARPRRGPQDPRLEFTRMRLGNLVDILPAMDGKQDPESTALTHREVMHLAPRDGRASLDPVWSYVQGISNSTNGAVLFMADSKDEAVLFRPGREPRDIPLRDVDIAELSPYAVIVQRTHGSTVHYAYGRSIRMQPEVHAQIPPHEGEPEEAAAPVDDVAAAAAASPEAVTPGEDGDGKTNMLDKVLFSMNLEAKSFDVTTLDKLLERDSGFRRDKIVGAIARRMRWPTDKVTKVMVAPPDVNVRAWYFDRISGMLGAYAALRSSPVVYTSDSWDTAVVFSAKGHRTAVPLEALPGLLEENGPPMPAIIVERAVERSVRTAKGPALQQEVHLQLARPIDLEFIPRAPLQRQSSDAGVDAPPMPGQRDPSRRSISFSFAAAEAEVEVAAAAAASPGPLVEDGGRSA